jgi:hypothetical protein
MRPRPPQHAGDEQGRSVGAAAARSITRPGAAVLGPQRGDRPRAAGGQLRELLVHAGVDGGRVAAVARRELGELDLLAGEQAVDLAVLQVGVEALEEQQQLGGGRLVDFNNGGGLPRPLAAGARGKAVHEA